MIIIIIATIVFTIIIIIIIISIMYTHTVCLFTHSECRQFMNFSLNCKFPCEVSLVLGSESIDYIQTFWLLHVSPMCRKETRNRRKKIL